MLQETPEEVKRWFREAVRDLWPVAVGSVSLRRSLCIRKHCVLCKSGERHVSYAFYGRQRSRRFSIYVPDELAPLIEQAIQNGRQLHQFMSEAGRRYTQALKNERYLKKYGVPRPSARVQRGE
jgi:hypothetical protein